MAHIFCMDIYSIDINRLEIIRYPMNGRLWPNLDGRAVGNGPPQLLDLGVKQPPIGSAEAIGPKRLFQVGRLEQHSKTRDRALADLL